MLFAMATSKFDLATFDAVNATRYRGGAGGGHYESFFVRANHPTRPLALWIRYTLFCPRADPASAVGELWAIYFDGEQQRHVAVKQVYPLDACTFDLTGLAVTIGPAHLTAARLAGQCCDQTHTLAWELRYAGDAPPLLLLPAAYYHRRWPKAKSLVGLPMAVFNGTVTVDGQAIAISDWVGSQNHNWGSQHTDFYAWGQVAGFDTHPDTFLELASARLKLGPLWTPFLSPIVLCHAGQTIVLNSLMQTMRPRIHLHYFTWQFAATSPLVDLQGTISAPRSAFVGLRYANPPGGSKVCLNTKIAACTLQLIHKLPGLATTEVLSTRHRAAFEILTTDSAHGVGVYGASEALG